MTRARARALGPLALALVGALASLPASWPAIARDYGQAGALFAVVEPDLLAVIYARLLRLEASGETAKLNAELKRRTVARVNRPAPVEGLVRANIALSWLFDPTITLETAIVDDMGRTIWPAGTRVNPLDSVKLRAALVFLDGDDPDQLAWALGRAKTGLAKLILTGGAPLELMRARQVRFYFDQGGALVRHFSIRALPALVEQQDRTLQVSEIALPQTRRPQP